MSDMLSFNSCLWFGSKESFSPTLAAGIQQNSLFGIGASWTLSTSAADGGRTCLRNVWQTLAGRCGRGHYHPSPFLRSWTRTKRLPAALMVPVWLPALIRQFMQRSAFITLDERRIPQTLTSSLLIYFRNPSPTLRTPDQWCRSFSHFISQ